MAFSEEVKRDIANIIRISSKYDMRKPENVDRIIDYSLRNNLMGSSVGQEYINRLNEISNGSLSNKKCIFCKANESADGVVCNECFDKFSAGKLKIFGENEIDEIAKEANSKNTSADPSLENGLKVFCQECGEELHSNVCAKCNTKRGEGYNYCGCCGNKVPLPEIKQKPRKSYDIVNTIRSLNKKVFVGIAAGIVLLIALILGVVILSNKSGNKQGDFAVKKTNSEGFAEAYETSLEDYLLEIGYPETDAQVFQDNEANDDINRYRISIAGNNVGGIYIKEEDKRVNSLIVMSPMDAEGTSMLMIPAVKAVNPGMSSKEASSILIETITIYNNDMQSGGNGSAKNVAEKYSYMYGISDGIYMLRIDSVK